MTTGVTYESRFRDSLTALPPVPQSSESDQRPARHHKILVVAFVFALLVLATLSFDGPRLMIADFLVPSADHHAPPRTEIASGRASREVPASGTVPSSPLPLNALPNDITGSGFVVAPSEVLVFPKEDGEIVNLAVRLGQQVSAGQILAIADSPASHFALEQAQLDEQGAKIAVEARTGELGQAQATFTRSTRLFAGGSISRQQLETAQGALDSAATALEQARQALLHADLAVRIAQSRLNDLSIRAPISGTVTDVQAHVGDRMRMHSQDSQDSGGLFRITDMSRLVIDADVAETAARAIRVGLTGDAVLDGLPGRSLSVAVDQIDPIVSREKGTVSLRLLLTTTDPDMRPGMAARIHLTNSFEGGRS